jgi:hypothetical protein
MYGLEITTCYYKGLLHEYVMLCYGFLTHDPTCSAEVSCTKWPLLQNVIQAVHTECHKDKSHPYSTEHDTQPIAYLISKQVIPYRARGGTCCPGVSTPKIWSLADSSMTNHIT